MALDVLGVAGSDCHLRPCSKPYRVAADRLAGPPLKASTRRSSLRSTSRMTRSGNSGATRPAFSAGRSGWHSITCCWWRSWRPRPQVCWSAGTAHARRYWQWGVAAALVVVACAVRRAGLRPYTGATG
jgi:hypothetical protein